MTKVAVLDDRAVLAVEGAESRDFLQGLLTQDLRLLEPGRPVWAGLLSPQGKYLFDMILHTPGGDLILADVEAARADELLRRLTLYRLRRRVDLARREDHVLAAWDGAEVGQPLDPRLPSLGRRWLADATPAVTASPADYDRHRLAHGVPDGSRDMMVDRLLWLEANAAELNGVSFDKGCYVGQENTARMHHRDRVRRRLLPVALDGEPGDACEIMAGARAAGELRSRRDGRGMAFLKLDLAEEPLRVGDAGLRVLWPEWLAREPAPAG